MKKWITIISIVSILALLGACGNDENTEKEKVDKTTTDTTAKKAKSTPKETNETTDTKKNETADKATTTDSNETKTTVPKENKKASAPTNSSKTEAPKSTTPKEAFSLSASGFKVSNVQPVLGGEVTTTYLSSSKSFQKDFESLTLSINQYKVEHVVGANKEVSTSNPESYLANKNGYVITLDISIKNRATTDKMYKADQISLLGSSKSVGGSLDNFVPSSFHLSGSSADPYNFSAGKTARGLLTFTMDEETYNNIAKNSQIGVPDPSRFDASSTKNSSQDNIIAPFPIK